MIGSTWTVSEVMTSRVLAVTPRTSFKQIVRALEDWRVSAAPVVDDERRVLGVVSEADLLPKEGRRAGEPLWTGDSAKSGATTAGELMTAPAVTIRADSPVALAARLMALHQVKRLPVVDMDNRLTGVVSRSDLLKVFTRSDDDIAAEVRQLAAEYFPAFWETLEVSVREGVVALGGRVWETAGVPLAARLVRGVEGVVDVAFDLGQEPPRRRSEPSPH
jgi:CBS domain-containing protein